MKRLREEGLKSVPGLAATRQMARRIAHRTYFVSFVVEHGKPRGDRV